MLIVMGKNLEKLDPPPYLQSNHSCLFNYLISKGFELYLGLVIGFQGENYMRLLHSFNFKQKIFAPWITRLDLFLYW